MFHQVTVATEDVQRVDNWLPGLICRHKKEDIWGGLIFVINSPLAIRCFWGILSWPRYWLWKNIKSTFNHGLTFLSFNVGISDEPGARWSKDGGHTELSTAGLAWGDLRGWLAFASGEKKVQIWDHKKRKHTSLGSKAYPEAKTAFYHVTVANWDHGGLQDYAKLQVC